MNETNPNITIWAEWFKTLIGPVLVILTGIGGFIYELVEGHDTTFATFCIGLIAMALGVSADLVRRGP